MRKHEAKQEWYGNTEALVLTRFEPKVVPSSSDPNTKEVNIYLRNHVRADLCQVVNNSQGLVMVDVVSRTANTDTKITFSTLDKERQEYISQFSEKVKLENFIFEKDLQKNVTREPLGRTSLGEISDQGRAREHPQSQDSRLWCETRKRSFDHW